MPDTLPVNLKKELAKMLYLNNKELFQTEIAARVHVSPRTLGRWIVVGKWEALRQSAVLSKADQVRRLLHIINTVADRIDEEEGIGSTKLADMMIKYTTAYKNLENDLGIQQIVETMILFGQFIQRHYPHQFRFITELSDVFVMEKLK